MLLVQFLFDHHLTFYWTFTNKKRTPCVPFYIWKIICLVIAKLLIIATCKACKHHCLLFPFCSAPLKLLWKRGVLTQKKPVKKPVTVTGLPVWGQACSSAYRLFCRHRHQIWQFTVTCLPTTMGLVRVEGFTASGARHRLLSPSTVCEIAASYQ